jgi:hypothetical protein
MKAHVGDRLVIQGNLGERDRSGEIRAILGIDGAPPYIVIWSDDGHVALVFPTSETALEHHGTGCRIKDAPDRRLSR